MMNDSMEAQIPLSRKHSYSFVWESLRYLCFDHATQMPKNSRLVIVILASSFLAPWNARAEDDNLFQRLSALRLLQMQSNLWNPEEKHGLAIGGSVEGHYTTNGALARDGTSDWYLAPVALISWSHDLADEWRVSVGADAGGFRYLRQPDLGTSYLDAWGTVARDFEVGAVRSSLYMTTLQQWTQLKNYSKSGSSTEIVAGWNMDWEIGHGHALTFNPSAFVTPYSLPWNAGYHSYGATISYGWSVKADVELSIFYNGYLTSYFSGQTDITQYVGLGVKWTPCEAFSLTASATQTWNASTDTDSNYSALDLGGMLGLTWRL